MAIGTAALILILSIYNGFDRIIEGNISDIDPDILLCSSSGRSFVPREQMIDSLLALESVSSVSCVLEENVFACYEQKQSTARAKGVDIVYESSTPLLKHITAGDFSLRLGDIHQACVGVGLARKMGINPRFKSRLELYYPSLEKSSVFGPEINEQRLSTSSLFGVGTEADNELIIMGIAPLRRLLELPDGSVSALEIRCTAKPSKELIAEMKAIAGPAFELQDRYEQNPALYKMMRYEKLAVFAILLFVVLVIAFNIFSSLSMLRIEKDQDCKTLIAMGAREALMRRIFLLEGWMVSLLGLACGLAAGVGLAWLQQSFELLKMPSGFSIAAYPCVLEAGDVLWTALGVAAIGFLISFTAVRQSK